MSGSLISWITIRKGTPIYVYLWLQGGYATGLVWEVKNGALQCLNASVELDVLVFDHMVHYTQRDTLIYIYIYLWLQGGCATGLVWEFKNGALQCLNASVELEVRIFDLVAHDPRKSVIVRCYQV